MSEKLRDQLIASFKVEGFRTPDRFATEDRVVDDSIIAVGLEGDEFRRLHPCGFYHITRKKKTPADALLLRAGGNVVCERHRPLGG